MFMCARVAIDLNLFDIITDSNGPVNAAELALKSKADEQLIGELKKDIAQCLHLIGI